MTAADRNQMIEVPGPDGRELSDWLKIAILFGGWALYLAIHKSLTKWVRSGRPLIAWTDFDEQDRAAIQDAAGRFLAPSLLIGRAKLRKAVGELESGEFRRLMKAARPLGVADSFAMFGPALVAIAQRGETDDLQRRIMREVLDRTAMIEQGIIGRIREGIDSDKTLAFAPTIERLLLAVGLAPQSQEAYLPMVVRTGVMDAVNDGQWDQFREEELAPAFPVWQYHAVIRPTSRPWHAIRNGRYWPSTTTFREVRGYGPVNVCNCLCNWSPVSQDRWEILRRYGSQVEPGPGSLQRGYIVNEGTGVMSAPR
jgi:hypothetical protein